MISIIATTPAKAAVEIIEVVIIEIVIEPKSSEIGVKTESAEIRVESISPSPSKSIETTVAPIGIESKTIVIAKSIVETSVIIHDNF